MESRILKAGQSLWPENKSLWVYLKYPIYEIWQNYYVSANSHEFLNGLE